MNIPNLHALGLSEAAKGASGKYPAIGTQKAPRLQMPSKYGHAKEISMDKDTVSGHWEMAGLPNLKGWGHFKPDYPSFPAEVIENIVRESGILGILGNKAASGTVIIQELGEEHIRTGKPIFYTSADSNMQIAAHENHFGLDRLYRLCEIAYKYVQPYNIGRIIARPFVGEKNGAFSRTTNRKDYAAQPFGETLLDRIKSAGGNVIAIGAINDIYAHRGITKAVSYTHLDVYKRQAGNRVENNESRAGEHDSLQVIDKNFFRTVSDGIFFPDGKKYLYGVTNVFFSFRMHNKKII